MGSTRRSTRSTKKLACSEREDEQIFSTPNLDSNSSCKSRKRKISHTDDLPFECKPSHCDQPSLVELLPDDILLKIFQSVGFSSLQNCMLVSKRWLQVALDKSLWAEIDLSHKKMDWNYLAMIFTRRPISICLHNSRINGALTFELPIQTDLQYLDLSNAVFVQFPTVDNLLSKCKNLKFLNLTNVKLTKSTCQIIGNCKNLESLSLSKTWNLNPEDVPTLLKTCSRLLSIDVSYTKWLTFDLMFPLFESISPVIERLNLASTDMTPQLLNSLTEKFKKLKELNLMNCDFMWNSHMDQLLRLKNLECFAISIFYYRYKVDIMTLKALPSFRHLDVYSNCITYSYEFGPKWPEIQINDLPFRASESPVATFERKIGYVEVTVLRMSICALHALNNKGRWLTRGNGVLLLHELVPVDNKSASDFPRLRIIMRDIDRTLINAKLCEKTTFKKVSKDKFNISLNRGKSMRQYRITADEEYITCFHKILKSRIPNAEVKKGRKART